MLAAAAALALACSCGDSERPPPEPTAPPTVRVDRFDVHPASVARGERATLTWAVSFAVETRIFDARAGEELLRSAEAAGVLTTPPITRDTDLRLEARGAGGDVEVMSASVLLVEDPSEVAIVRFSAEPRVVEAGGRVVLSWEVENATSVALLDAGGGTVLQDSARGAGSLVVYPEQTREYVAVAQGPGGPKRASLTVTVEVEPPPPVLETACNDPPRGPRAGWFVEAPLALPRPIVPAASGFQGSGGALGDLDGDGRHDLVVTSRGEAVTLLRNIGDLAFEEVELRGGIDGRVHAAGVSLADLDADGDLDIVLLGTGGAQLYENAGGWSFVRAPSAVLDAQPPAESVLVADLDGDRGLELLLNTFGRDLGRGDLEVRRDRLLSSRGGFVLEDVTGESGLVEEGRSWTSAAWDANRDGALDFHIANDTFSRDYGQGVRADTGLPGDVLMVARGRGGPAGLRFADATSAFGLDVPQSSMGALVGDVDGDGLFDLYVANFGKNPLYSGRAAGAFEETSELLGVGGARRSLARCAAGDLDPECLFISWGAVLEDFDNDGLAELLVVNGGFSGIAAQPALLFSRTGSAPGSPYVERDPELGCVDARAVLPADLDEDGDLDVVVIPRSSPVRVFENQTPRGPGWLRVRLEGRRSNRDGLGAVVTVVLDDGVRLKRLVGAGGMVHSSQVPEVHFGLGARAPATVEVHWPSGQRQVLEDIVRDHRLMVVEPE